MPVAVMWGTLDPVLPYSQTESLPASFTIDTVKDAGHMLVEEVPARVTDMIRRMSARNGNRPAP
jgi:pyruvate dehydrogenase E2 component (dihydrolipoamide acetyltransferase)